MYKINLFKGVIVGAKNITIWTGGMLGAYLSYKGFDAINEKYIDVEQINAVEIDEKDKNK